MSHAGTWRASCNITLFIPSFHIGNLFQSTRRDKSRRWLWRLVRRRETRRNLDDEKRVPGVEHSRLRLYFAEAASENPRPATRQSIESETNFSDVRTDPRCRCHASRRKF